MSERRIVFSAIAGVLVLSCMPSIALATIPDSERAALIDLYNSTTGAGWSQRDNWRNPGDTDFNDVDTECTWYGVTCDGTEEHVSWISLKSNNLNGSLPASIGDFPSLTVLELLGNPNLTGAIPASIGNLAALQELNAYDGSLTGPIPPEIGSLSNLSTLQLAYNQLGGAIPPQIGNLSALTELALESNQLSGSIPPEIGDLSNLRYLRLRDNQLTGSLPSQIGNLSSLQSLDLSGNTLSGALPNDISNLAALSNLYLTYNDFSGPIPSGIGGLASLRWLDLGRNSFSGAIPPELGDLAELRWLRLERNKLEGTIPDEIVKLANLFDGWGLEIDYNALHTGSDAVDEFLDLKHSSAGDWRATQTIAPTGVSIGVVTDSTVELTWTPIEYTTDPGGYTAWFATSSGGPYTSFARTADKSVTSINVFGLSPVVTYYFYVDTVTDPHAQNGNTVVSEPSLEVSTRTFSGGGPTLSIGDATVVEGDNGAVNAVFTVSLYPASGGPVTVNVVTGNETATAGSDYVAATVPLTFSPSDTFKIASVSVNGDMLVEGDETFFAYLTSGSGAGIGRNVGTGTIADDDAGLVAHERQALIDLYTGTNGAGWAIRTNWRNAGDTDFNDPGTECSWWGVTCDLTGQRVTVIRLERNNLDGTLPDSIGDFTALELLLLGGNGSLVGPIPPSIGKLAALEKLWTYDGSLSGPIPAEIGKLSNLEHMSLRGNSLSGPIPSEIGDLSSLQYLDLEENELSGSIPPQIGDLGSLIRLELGYNGLSGTVPAEIRTLTQLEHLNLVANSLSGQIPPEIGDLGNLRDLLLQSNQLTGPIPSAFGTLLNLRSLRLSQNQLSGPIPTIIENLSQLYRLELQQNRLSGPIPPEICSLTALTSLYLDENLLTGPIPSEIDNLTGLTGLGLQHNLLSGPIPPALGDLPGLIVLNLGGNSFTGSIPSELVNLTTLSDMDGLDIRWNGLHTDDVFLAAFLNLKHSNLGDWRDTQTAPPENLSVTSVADHTVWLSWDAIDYTDDDGGYEVFASPTGGGSWTSGGWTSDKNETLFPVTSLDPGITYDFVVVSFTDPHTNNLNLVMSDASDIQMATTSNLGCPQPEIEIDLSSGITLSVSGPFSSYSWSTGESTSSIVVDPPEALWYWVTVMSGGGCEDTATKFVSPPIFTDGFEGGDTSGWSSTTP